MEIKIVPILIPPDNFSYVVSQDNDAVVIDASDATPIIKYINNNSLNLLAVLSTHHHSDHTQGNCTLKETAGCCVAAMDNRTACIDKLLIGGDTVRFGKIAFKVIHVPGHTKLQCAYLLEEQGCVFTGDTLFGAGCGRIFESGAEAMFHSLETLASLPENTKVYFGHEYTKDNIEFAQTIEPDNRELAARYCEVIKIEASGGFTVPSTIGLEKRTNPFLRCKEIKIRRKLDMVNRSPIAVFAKLRAMKDIF